LGSDNMEAIKIINGVIFHYDTDELSVNNPDILKEFKEFAESCRENSVVAYIDKSQGLVIY